MTRAKGKKTGQRGNDHQVLLAVSNGGGAVMNPMDVVTKSKAAQYAAQLRASRPPEFLPTPEQVAAHKAVWTLLKAEAQTYYKTSDGLIWVAIFSDGSALECGDPVPAEVARLWLPKAVR